jgi:predicted ArsR family transcriptional regulator
MLSPEDEEELDQICRMTDEEMDAELRRLGVDPAALSERAEAFVAGLRREGLLPQVRKKREP